MFTGRSLVTLVGVSETATEATLTFSAPTAGGPTLAAATAGGSQTVMLNRGDVVQFLSATYADDLTGTTITATQPVAVISGHQCINLPGTACDHLEEQLFPVEAWGTRYAVSAFGTVADVEFAVRISAARDNTNITFDPPSTHAAAQLDAGESLDFITTAYFVVDASEPVLLAQFVMGRGVGGEDPAMVYMIPVEQFRPHSVVYAAEPFPDNFLLLTGPSDNPPVVDGAAVMVAPRPLGTSGMSVWQVPITGGTHTVGTPQGATSYGVVVYGVSPAASYAYPGGLNQLRINPLI